MNYHKLSRELKNKKNSKPHVYKVSHSNIYNLVITGNNNLLLASELSERSVKKKTKKKNSELSHKNQKNCNSTIILFNLLIIFYFHPITLMY